MARVGGGQWVAGLSGCVAMVALAYHPTAIRASSVAQKSRPTAESKVQRAILSPVYTYTPTGAYRPGAGALAGSRAVGAGLRRQCIPCHRNTRPGAVVSRAWCRNVRACGSSERAGGYVLIGGPKLKTKVGKELRRGLDLDYFSFFVLGRSSAVTNSDHSRQKRNFTEINKYEPIY